jgi:hypothetical protein
MTQLGEAMRDLRDRVAAQAEGRPDRPTSLYQAGAVGGRRPPDREPVEGPVDDTAASRRRTRDARSEQEPAERTRRPSSTVVLAPRRPSPLRAMLATPQSLRTAVVIGEVLGPPVSMRDAGQRSRGQ